MDETSELAEFIHSLSFEEYAKLFLKIEDQDSNLVDFELNEAQRIVYDRINRQVSDGKPVRILILKGRQQGMSTFSQGYLTWKMLTAPRVKCLTVGHVLSAVHDIFDKFHVMISELPNELKCGIEAFKRGRRCVFSKPMRGQYRADSAEKPDDVGRAGTFQHLHLTEIPQWANPELSMQAVLACVPDTGDTTIIIESTAKGRGNWFYEAWVDAVAKVNSGEEPEFFPVFVPWFKTKRYARSPRSGEPGLSAKERLFGEKYSLTDEQVFWYRGQRTRLGDRVVEEFPSEWEEAFISSGSPFFRSEALEFCRSNVTTPLRRGMFRTSTVKGVSRASFEDAPFGPTWIFEEPTRDGRYSIGVDFSSGQSSDYSAIAVVDVDEKRVVATHRSKSLPDDVLNEAFILGTVYNGAVVVPERTGMGHALVDRLVNALKYANVFRDRDRTKVGSSKATRFGWSTTEQSRKRMLEDLSSLVHRNEMCIPCSRVCCEMETFVFVNPTRAEADGNNHDDMIMSLAMAVQGFRQSPIGSSVRPAARRGKYAISERIGY